MLKAYRPWYITGDDNSQVPPTHQIRGLKTNEIGNRTLLDLGCADGLTTSHMAKYRARLARGMALLERAVEVGRSLVRFSYMSDQVKLIVGDLRWVEQVPKNRY